MSGSTRRSALLISIFFPPEFGGGATGAWNRALVLQKLGFAVFVLCGFPAYPTGKVTAERYRRKLFCVESVDSITVIRFRLLPLSHNGIISRILIFGNFILGSLILMPKVLSLTGALDLTYARSPILLSFISGYLYSKCSRSTFVFEVPDLWPEEFVTIKSRFTPLLMKIGKVVANIAYQSPDIIITVSNLAAEHISRTYNPGKKVHGLSVGVDPTNFGRLSKQKSRDVLVQKAIIPKDAITKFMVLYSGLISEAQHVETILHAAAGLNDPEVLILIIGEGPDKDKLVELKSELKLENVRFLPKQPRELIPTIISACDACTVMLAEDSIFDIALPTKFYEYLASFRPLIAVCSGELAQIIQSNEIGFVSRSGDQTSVASAIKKLKDSSSLMQSMERNCAVALESFTLDNVASKFNQIINEGEMVSYA